TKTAGFKKNQVLGVSDLHQELAAKFWRELPGWIGNGELKPLDFEVIDGLNAMKVNNLLDDYRDGRPTNGPNQPSAQMSRRLIGIQQDGYAHILPAQAYIREHEHITLKSPRSFYSMRGGMYARRLHGEMQGSDRGKCQTE
ncbi:hypothetical protein AbraIFM66951_005986, partial [Aspergillus brasiliensis]